MKYLLISISLVLGLSSISAQSEVTIVVENIKTIKGKVMICMVDDKADFLENCKHSAMVKVDGPTATVTFDDVSDGSYAISIFHDKNNDDELSTNFLGIPKEPYGFSNNVSAMFGPPSFEKCLFDVKENKSVTIRL